MKPGHMMKAGHTFFALTFLVYGLFSVNGCAPPISKQLREQVSEELTLKVVLKKPEAYKGKTILLSGVIISSVNLKEGTMIEVLQKPADMQGRPKDVDESQGRFLALYPGYLDVAIYNGGRKVTVAGEVQGKRIQPLGEIDYTYPLISAREIHLWPLRKKTGFILILTGIIPGGMVLIGIDSSMGQRSCHKASQSGIWKKAVLIL
jgi:outer membrane lipoprotein